MNAARKLYGAGEYPWRYLVRVSPVLCMFAYFRGQQGVDARVPSALHRNPTGRVAGRPSEYAAGSASSETCFTGLHASSPVPDQREVNGNAFHSSSTETHPVSATAHSCRFFTQPRIRYKEDSRGPDDPSRNIL